MTQHEMDKWIKSAVPRLGELRIENGKWRIEVFSNCHLKTLKMGTGVRIPRCARNDRDGTFPP